MPAAPARRSRASRPKSASCSRSSRSSSRTRPTPSATPPTASSCVRTGASASASASSGSGSSASPYPRCCSPRRKAMPNSPPLPGRCWRPARRYAPSGSLCATTAAGSLPWCPARASASRATKGRRCGPTRTSPSARSSSASARRTRSVCAASWRTARSASSSVPKRAGWSSPTDAMPRCWASIRTTTTATAPRRPGATPTSARFSWPGCGGTAWSTTIRPISSAATARRSPYCSPRSCWISRTAATWCPGSTISPSARPSSSASRAARRA
ncbi:MAG: hypothetical protein MOGDAGHF_01369 [Rhodocyclaceae bacterium]|nr:hypothetical protein [Rhodocyclaceae bacterium]